jgi:hypothetical protein
MGFMTASNVVVQSSIVVDIRHQEASLVVGGRHQWLMIHLDWTFYKAHWIS